MVVPRSQVPAGELSLETHSRCSCLRLVSSDKRAVSLCLIPHPGCTVPWQEPSPVNVEESHTVTRVGSSKCPILSSVHLAVVPSTDPVRRSLDLGTGLPSEPDGFGFPGFLGRFVPGGTVASPGGTFESCSTALAASSACVAVPVGRAATPRGGSHPLLPPIVT